MAGPQNRDVTMSDNQPRERLSRTQGRTPSRLVRGHHAGEGSVPPLVSLALALLNLVRLKNTPF
jgi:hypothetical protein